MIAVLVFIGLFAGILATILIRIRAPWVTWGIVFTGFALRMAFVLVDNVLQVFGGMGDASKYDATLWYVAQQWRSGVFLAPFTTVDGPGYEEFLFTVLFSPVYLIFGHHLLLARLAMAFVGVIVVLNVYLLTRELFDQRAGQYAAGITAIFPYWIYLSGILYRDMLVIAFLTLMAVYFVRWQADTEIRALVLCLVVAGLALSMRPINIVAIGALGVLAAYTKLDDSKWQKPLASATVTISLGMLLFFYGNQLTLDQIADRRLWLARENPGAYLTGVAYETVLELAVFAPIGMIYFVLVPFPWQTPGFLAIIAIFQNLIFWYPTLILSIYGIRNVLHTSGRKTILVPLLAYSLVGFLSYGFVEGNIGPAMRHRSQFQFIFFALAGVVLSQRVRLCVSRLEAK